MIFDVQFMMVESNLPMLLSLPDMINNNLDISIKSGCFIFDGNAEQLIMKHYCLTYN